MSGPFSDTRRPRMDEQSSSVHDHEADQLTHLLWTGGWDSTFALLYALIVQKQRVQTYYVMDTGRYSSQLEVDAMRSIKRMIRRSYADAAKRLPPIRIFDRLDFAVTEATKAALDQVRKETGVPLGIQYTWLARFASSMNLTDLQLSIHADDKAHEVLRDCVERIPGTGSGCYRIADRGPHGPLHEIFGRFRFPIFDRTKRDMQTFAAEHGFAEILEQTWFCHAPRRGTRPCGTCNPCMYTIQEGMGRRIPLRGRLRYRVKNLVSSIPGCYQTLSLLQRVGRRGRGGGH